MASPVTANLKICYSGSMYMNLKEIFTHIYRKNLWESDETASGLESTLEQTEVLIHLLPKLFSILGVQRLLDVPCGDFYWMQYVDLEQVHYHGGDVVTELIEQNQTRYAGPGISFSELDLTRSDLPEADLILIRDCFAFLSHVQVWRCLKNLMRHEFKYVLISTHDDISINNPSQTGLWRPLNLQRDPFSLPAPGKLFPEAAADKSLGLWSYEQLQTWAQEKGLLR